MDEHSTIVWSLLCDVRWPYVRWPTLVLPKKSKNASPSRGQHNAAEQVRELVIDDCMITVLWHIGNSSVTLSRFIIHASPHVSLLYKSWQETEALSCTCLLSSSRCILLQTVSSKLEILVQNMPNVVLDRGILISFSRGKGAYCTECAPNQEIWS